MGINKKKNFFAVTLIMGIKTYQIVLSPVLGQRCRFYPSCSNYFVEAIEKFGIFKAIVLFLKRILKCHPFHPGGYDPLPGENKK